MVSIASGARESEHPAEHTRGSVQRCSCHASDQRVTLIILIESSDNAPRTASNMPHILGSIRPAASTIKTGRYTYLRLAKAMTPTP